jgi:hypothetical protein
MSVQKKFDDTNRGVLFKDEKKTTAEDRDYSGEIDVRGEKFSLSGLDQTIQGGQEIHELEHQAQSPANKGQRRFLRGG